MAHRHGFDHLLFLLALLLPTVLLRVDGKLMSAARLAPVVRATVKIVTAFTLAHSLTLSLATLRWWYCHRVGSNRRSPRR